MTPKIALLLHKLQIQPSHTLSPHLLPLQNLLRILLLLTLMSVVMIRIRNAPIGNSMHNMDPPRAVFPRQRLRQHAHSTPSSPVRRIPRVRAQRAQRAREDERALLVHGMPLLRGGILLQHPLGRELAEAHRARDVDLQAVAELLGGLLLEGNLVRVLDVPDGDLQLQVAKLLLVPLGDAVEGALELRRGSIRLEGFELAALRRGGDGGGQVIAPSARKQCDGQVSVGG